MEQTQLETGSSLKLRLCCEQERCGGYRGVGFKPDNPDLVLISCKDVFLSSEVFSFSEGFSIFNNYKNTLVLPCATRNENFPL